METVMDRTTRPAVEHATDNAMESTMRGHATEPTLADQVEVGPLGASEGDAALAVMVRGMRDNPTHLAAFGVDPDRREHAVRRLFAAAFRVIGLGTNMVVARRPDGTIVGVCGMSALRGGQPTVRQQLRMMPAVLANGPRSAIRTIACSKGWSAHVPSEPHWRIGPVVVVPELQGQGIGSLMMEVLCARVDAAGALAFLETDKAINVRFYERFGFAVTAEADVIGTPTWFMLRRPAGRA